MRTFQEGAYPIKQIIYVELDSVLGSLFIETMKQRYGKISILHQIRATASEASDLEILMLTTCPVISTCWSHTRLKAVLPAYLEARGWEPSDVRVYQIGSRLDK